MQPVVVVQVDIPEGNAGIGARRPDVVTRQRVKVLHARVAPHHQRQVAQVVPHMLPEPRHVAMVVCVTAGHTSSGLVSMSNASDMLHLLLSLSSP